MIALVGLFALGVWWQACQRYEFAMVKRALEAHVMDPDSGKWPPMPADIVKHLHGTSADRSLIAWGKVLNAMQRVGQYESIDFSDAATHCAIEDMGGWPTLCRTLLKELPFAQKRFCDAHRAYSARGHEVRPVSHLIGIFEAENRVAGRRVAEPVRIAGQIPGLVRIAA